MPQSGKTREFSNYGVSNRLRTAGPLLLLAVLAAFICPTGVAHAAARPPTVARSGTDQQHAARSSTKWANPARSRPKPRRASTKPLAPVRGKAPAAPAKSAQRSSRAAATRSALTAAGTRNACSGAVPPDTVTACATPSSTGTDSYTAELTGSKDLLIIRATTSSGDTLPVTVTAPDGSTVSCPYTNDWSLPTQCPTSGAGNYTLQVQSNGSAYTLAYTPLLSDGSCAVADPSFSAPTIQGTTDPGAVGNCYTVALKAGDVVHVNLTSSQYQNLSVNFYDATGSRVCQDSAGDCTLTGTGPYRALTSDLSGLSDTYHLQLNDVTRPSGCLAAAQQPYGVVPDTSSAVRCRTLQVDAAGQYQIRAVAPAENSPSGTLYTPAGAAACTNSGPFCQLAAGTYDFVVDTDPAASDKLGVVFIAADESRGCAASGDTDFASGPASGTFSGLGEEVCLTLPTASGSSDYMFNQATAGDAGLPGMTVVDATGAQQCPSADFTWAVCQLTGIAPFRVVLSSVQTGQNYQALVQRTDSLSGCASWPQSGFGGSWGAQVSLTASAPIKCLAIPADAHSTGELIDYTNTSNKVNASINIADPSGKSVCVGASSSICAFKSGVAYTALMATPSGAVDTYKLVRRDVTSTAKCAAPASSKVGGPSTGIVLTSALDSACVRLDAAAGDYVWAGVRTVAPAPAGAVLMVTDPAGRQVCREWGPSCKLHGSASYQLIVLASGYSGVAVSAHLDSWIVGTSSGWASQCTAHRLSANGFGPLSVTLTETSAAYCAVVAIQPSDSFAVYGTSGPTGAGTPWVSMGGTSDWSGASICSNEDTSGLWATCQTQSIDSASDAVLLVTPYQAATPMNLSFQGFCQQGCATHPASPTISSISPASGPAAADNQVVVHGTGLSLGTSMELAADGSPVQNAILTPTAVSSDATSLTLRLNSTGVTPGKYDLVASGAGYTVGTASPQYLPGAYTVTAALAQAAPGKFVPITPKRFLDTRYGTGAKAARVASHGVVALQVAGVGGIPTSGVTGVVMNVTAVGPTTAGFVTVYPDSRPVPDVSNLNFTSGQTVANLVTVPVVDGKVDLRNGSLGTVDLLADVTGYYTSGGAGSGLTPIGPKRILDTRNGTGAKAARVTSHGTLSLQVAGVAGIPSSGVTAVVLNVTAVDPSAVGYVTAYPDSQSKPFVSDLNFAAGQTVPNLVTVPVVDGKVDLYNGSLGTVDLVADVTGYYAAVGSGFHPAGPVRLMDTRSGLGGDGGTVVPHGAATLQVSDIPGVPADATAVVLNVTVTGPQAAGYLTVYPDGQPVPTASNLNFTAGQTVANLVIVPVVDGRVDLYNGSTGSTEVIADLNGYFTG